MKLENIKDFVDYLVALEAFDVDANVGFQLDKTGDVEGTQVNINFRYPQDLLPDDTVMPTEEEVGVAPPTDSELVGAAMEKLFSTLAKKSCCKDKCNKDSCCDDKKIKTGFHSFPGGFALHAVSCKEEPAPECEEGPTEEQIFEEILRDLPQALERFRRK